MKKSELLKMINGELLEKLFGFCYARTSDSYEAQELCSDIIFALIKTANTEGSIENIYPFIWRVARNVYADFSKKRRQYSNMRYEGNADDILPYIADEQIEDNSVELLASLYLSISFLTKAYREVMIMFYLDGLSAAEIARLQGTSEVAVRQRLFYARKKVRNEVEEMGKICNKPVALDKIEYVIWGNGNPGWGDPRDVCTRQLSKHIVWLCHKKPMSAAEIANELNVPTVYVEEELEILAAGKNGQYGFLRKMDNGKYAINIILLDKERIQKAQALYLEQLPNISDIILEFIEKNKKEYMSFPYLNKKTDMNLILWQQIYGMAHVFSEKVEAILGEKYFADTDKPKRPFSIFGYVDNGIYYGGGWDGVDAENVCGYSQIHLDNIYIARIKKHFGCGLNVAADPLIQLALRAIGGLDAKALSEVEKEHAAKAVECGYLYCEGEMLYTKILVNDLKDSARLFELNKKLADGFLDNEAEIVAGKLADMIRKTVPEYLLGEWAFFNWLADMPVLDSLVETLIEKKVLTPPEDGIGAEGCWMGVKKDEKIRIQQ